MDQRLMANIIANVRADVDDVKDLPIGARARKVMEVVKDHWLANLIRANLDDKFAIAVAALYMLADDEEKTRIRWEMDLLRGLSAAERGVPVDFGQVLGDTPLDPIGLVMIWKDVVGTGMVRTEFDAKI